MRCDRCKREGVRGFRAVFDHGHRVYCVNESACRNRVVKLTESDPATLLASKRILAIDSDCDGYGPEAFCVHVEGGITVVCAVGHYSPDDAYLEWRVELGNPGHPEVRTAVR